MGSLSHKGLENLEEKKTDACSGAEARQKVRAALHYALRTGLSCDIRIVLRTLELTRRRRLLLLRQTLVPLLQSVPGTLR